MRPVKAQSAGNRTWLRGKKRGGGSLLIHSLCTTFSSAADKNESVVQRPAAATEAEDARTPARAPLEAAMAPLRSSGGSHNLGPPEEGDWTFMGLTPNRSSPACVNDNGLKRASRGVAVADVVVVVFALSRNLRLSGCLRPLARRKFFLHVFARFLAKIRWRKWVSFLSERLVSCMQ